MSCHEHLQIEVKKITYWFKNMPSLTRFLQNLCVGDFVEIHITHPEKTPSPEEQIMMELTPEKAGY